jgi:GDPmannose 4,6-dehydratase
MSTSWSGSGVNQVCKAQYGNVVIRIDPEYFRPTEVPILLGDSTKARTKLGWEPVYTLDMLIEEMVQSEMERLG